MATRENPGRAPQRQQPPDEGTASRRGQALELAARGPSALIGSFRDELATIAPKHIDAGAFVALAAAYVRRDSYLTEAMTANPASLILTLRECAALGHVPRKGEFSLVPFRDRNAPGGWAIVGVEEWRGVVERMFRSGGVRSVHVHVGRDGDPLLSFQKGRDQLPRHEYDEFASRAERGPLKAVWAWAVLMHGGVSDVAWLNRHEVARHRAMSKTATSTKGAPGGNFWGPEWPDEGPNTEAMWKKTALHVLEGLVPTSSAYRWEVAQAGAAVAQQVRPDVPDVDPARGTDWIDAEEVAPQQQPHGDDADGWPAAAKPGSGVPAATS